MGIVIIILIVGGIIWYKQTIGSDNAKNGKRTYPWEKIRYKQM